MSVQCIPVPSRLIPVFSRRIPVPSGPIPVFLRHIVSDHRAVVALPSGGGHVTIGRWSLAFSEINFILTAEQLRFPYTVFPKGWLFCPTILIVCERQIQQKRNVLHPVCKVRYIAFIMRKNLSCQQGAVFSSGSLVFPRTSVAGQTQRIAVRRAARSGCSCCRRRTWRSGCL